MPLKAAKQGSVLRCMVVGAPLEEAELQTITLLGRSDEVSS